MPILDSVGPLPPPRPFVPGWTGTDEARSTSRFEPERTTGSNPNGDPRRRTKSDGDPRRRTKSTVQTHRHGAHPGGRPASGRTRGRDAQGEREAERRGLRNARGWGQVCRAAAERERERQTHRPDHQRKRDHQNRPIPTTQARGFRARSPARVSRKEPQKIGQSHQRRRGRSGEDRTRGHATSTGHLRRTLQNVRNRTNDACVRRRRQERNWETCTKRMGGTNGSWPKRRTNPVGSNATDDPANAHA
eukprot:scaffold616_cov306-Pavlova_lutheri.AAC.28